ncbi:hypothetical protein GGF44_002014 [Coemansia sp. RSA 1694]|nr:hypothetical protein GGF44_002014 [Coemansia sp. RSA 1694]
MSDIKQHIQDHRDSPVVLFVLDDIIEHERAEKVVYNYAFATGKAYEFDPCKAWWAYTQYSEYHKDNIEFESFKQVGAVFFNGLEKFCVMTDLDDFVNRFGEKLERFKF